MLTGCLTQPCRRQENLTARELPGATDLREIGGAILIYLCHAAIWKLPVRLRRKATCRIRFNQGRRDELGAMTVSRAHVDYASLRSACWCGTYRAGRDGISIRIEAASGGVSSEIRFAHDVPCVDCGSRQGAITGNLSRFCRQWLDWKDQGSDPGKSG